MYVMIFRKFSQFERQRIRDTLGKYGITQQGPYYAFVRKIKSKCINTGNDLQECINEYTRRGLNEEALKDLAMFFRPELRME